jgi:hypothetical protein
MEPITYGEYDGTTNRMPVYLAGTHVGDIRGVSFGWQYFPKGSKTGGFISKEIAKIKASLEGK